MVGNRNSATGGTARGLRHPVLPARAGLNPSAQPHTLRCGARRVKGTRLGPRRPNAAVGVGDETASVFKEQSSGALEGLQTQEAREARPKGARRDRYGRGEGSTERHR